MFRNENDPRKENPEFDEMNFLGEIVTYKDKSLDTAFRLVRRVVDSWGDKVDQRSEVLSFELLRFYGTSQKVEITKLIGYVRDVIDVARSKSPSVMRNKSRLPGMRMTNAELFGEVMEVLSSTHGRLTKPPAVERSLPDITGESPFWHHGVDNSPYQD